MIILNDILLNKGVVRNDKIIQNFVKYYINIGPRTNQHRLSCVCLHSDRNADERTNNLQRFKDNQVRFLICTDVAARGIDVSGLPFGKIEELCIY